MKFLFKAEYVEYEYLFNNHKHTIIFLHGWGGDKFSFLQTINLTKNKFNVLSLTMPTTSPTTLSWNMFDYIELIKAILKLHNIKSGYIVCHSFGFRVALLLNKIFKIKGIVVTGGAGLKKENKFLNFKKINQNNNKIALKNDKNKNLFNQIASKDYISLSNINRISFKNIVNLNLKFAIKFDCPMLLFWGKHDTSTPLRLAKTIKKNNEARLVVANSNHFAYLEENANFNHETLNFLEKVCNL